MRICVILEGCYPYVTGGVSSWMHQYIQAMPQHEFVVWAINADPWLNALADAIAPLADTHPYCPKSTYNALDCPEVRAAALGARDRGGRVVLTGVVAECCVLWTACAAIDLGCHVLYLTDAVSGLDRPKEAASELVLSGLAPLQCELMTTADYLTET